MFPEIEADYEVKLAAFEAGAREYGKDSLHAYWEMIECELVHVGLDSIEIDLNFFDWRKIEQAYREAVASYYQEKHPAYGVTPEPEILQSFFAASEFGFSKTDATADSLDKDIHNFSLGAWPKFREALILNDEIEAAHLASVIYKETEGDWKPVGDRAEPDPIKYLHRLQSGNAVQRHVKFTLYRLQHNSHL